MMFYHDVGTTRRLGLSPQPRLLPLKIVLEMQAESNFRFCPVRTHAIKAAAKTKLGHNCGHRMAWSRGIRSPDVVGKIQWS
jgi:hypothetical protein